MDLHIVGGFLGSGKTTAIAAAAKLLMAQGQRVGVVTNDQGKYLVDTAFFALADVPAVEVTGGCFCCNYDDLDARLTQLSSDAQPDVVFAESVGSCADVVATVLKPLQDLRQSPASLSVFADSRLLRRRLHGDPMPFSDDVVYIFDQQIAEADLLVINKIDLIGASAGDLLRRARERFPAKTIKLQHSLDDTSVAEWVALLERFAAPQERPSLVIDYDRYGAGEARLAWLNSELHFTGAAGNGAALARQFLAGLLARLRAEHSAIGHLKVLIQDGTHQAKISFPTLEETGWEAQLPPFAGADVTVLVNARVETAAETLHDLVLAAAHDAAHTAGASVGERNVEFFHPAFPTPTHRFA